MRKNVFDAGLLDPIGGGRFSTPPGPFPGKEGGSLPRIPYCSRPLVTIFSKLSPYCCAVLLLLQLLGLTTTSTTTVHCVYRYQ